MAHRSEVHVSLTDLYNLTQEADIAATWPKDVLWRQINMAVICASGGIRNDSAAQMKRAEALQNRERAVAASLGTNEMGLQDLMRKVENSPGYRILSAKPSFQLLLKSFARKASLPSPGNFSDPKAWLWIVGACALCVAIFEYRTTKKIQPKIAYKPTKEKAYNAVSALLSCQNDGLLLSHFSAAITYKELKELKIKLKSAIDGHEQQHDDKHVHARHATKDFAFILYRKFGVVSPVLVKNFAAMIGYHSKKIDPLLKKWRTELKDTPRSSEK
jgi:hypothetical protein